MLPTQHICITNYSIQLTPKVHHCALIHLVTKVTQGLLNVIHCFTESMFPYSFELKFTHTHNLQCYKKKKKTESPQLYTFSLFHVWLHALHLKVFVHSVISHSCGAIAAAKVRRNNTALTYKTSWLLTQSRFCVVGKQWPFVKTILTAPLSPKANNETGPHKKICYSQWKEMSGH